MSMFHNKLGVVLREEAQEGGDAGGTDVSTPDITLDSITGALNDDLRGEFGEVFKDVKDIEGLVKTAINGQRMIGSSIRIPSEDADDEARAKFYEKLSGVDGLIVNKDEATLRKSLGVPDDPSGYKVDLSELPDEIQVSQDELDQRLKEWHELGLTPAQVERQAKAWVESEKAEYEAWQKTNHEAEKQLKAEFGAAFDEKMQLVNYVTKNVMDAEDVAYMKETGALLRPGVIKMLAKMGEQLQDNGTIEAARRANATYTPDEARERIAEIEAHAGYLDPSHPQHKSLIERRQKLYEQAFR